MCRYFVTLWLHWQHSVIIRVIIEHILTTRPCISIAIYSTDFFFFFFFWGVGVGWGWAGFYAFGCGRGDNSVGRAPDLWLKGRTAVVGEVSSLELPFCVDSYALSISPPVSCKGPCSFCQECKRQVTPEYASPLTQRSLNRLNMLSRHSVGTYQINKLTSNLSGNACSHSFLSLLSHCGLMLAWRVELVCTSWSPLNKREKKSTVESCSSHTPSLPQNPCMHGKSHYYSYVAFWFAWETLVRCETNSASKFWH